jgi:hypothetical protein
MACLRAAGIEVDMEQAAPENATNEPNTSTGKWEHPMIYPSMLDSNIKNKKSKGQWNLFSWATIADMDLLSIFQMCMPEKYIIDTCIPATNQFIEGEKLTLCEFYQWLGCRFFMACFFGVNSMDLWRRQNPVNQIQGAPFRLNDVMSLKRFSFRAIDSGTGQKVCPAMTLTNTLRTRRLGLVIVLFRRRTARSFSFIATRRISSMFAKLCQLTPMHRRPTGRLGGLGRRVGAALSTQRQ